MLRFALVALVFLAAQARAQLAPPSVRIARPFGVAPGATITFEVRGQNLDGASALRFDRPRIKAEAIELAKPDGNDARLGRKLSARATFPPDLAPGEFSVRVVTPGGISNPAIVRVGRSLPMVGDVEPNDELRKARAIVVPAAIEGAIEPGNDVDLFAVDLKAGETLVAEAIAARSGSGLDPLLTLFDPDGREVAFNDDAFGRDAAISATALVAGRHVVQIQDANGRNRDNNTEQKLAREYRLEIGKFPLVTSVFPPGARRGRITDLHLVGTNLPPGSVHRFEPGADVPPGDATIGIVAPQGAANPVTVRVGDLPETTETEPNHDVARIQEVTVPAAINGGLDVREGGDVDLFRLKAAGGGEGEYRITAYAARVGSRADPVVTVLDDKGDSQGEDDDKLGRDARIDRAIDSKYGIVLAVRDYFNRGGPGFVYRIEIELIGRRGLILTADLGARTLPRSGGVAVPLTVERRGYDGPLTVLAGDLPPGVSAIPVTLTPKAQNAFLILTAAADAPLGPLAIRLVTRDVPFAAEIVARERLGTDGQGREVTAEMPTPMLAVAERAALGVTIEPAEIALPPGGQAALKVKLDRRGDASKKGVKIRILPPDGDWNGLEPLPELSVAAGAKEATATLKAAANAPPNRHALAARARFDDAAEALGVCSPPVGVQVVPR